MQSLEMCLDTNPGPLERYCAKYEFSAENIQFLTQVRKWKANYERVVNHVSPQMRTDLYNLAVEIYVCFVEPRYSELTVNLESRIYKTLAEVFGSALIALNRRPSSHSSDVTPWERPTSWNEFEAALNGILPGNDGSESGHESISGFPFDKAIPMTSLSHVTSPNSTSQESLKSVSSTVYHGHDDGSLTISCEVPDSFDEKVFDAAEKSVRYMVLNNSWRNYQNALEKGSITSAHLIEPESGHGQA